MRKKVKVKCNCSVCSCGIKLPKEDFISIGGLCALCRNDIHAANSKISKLEKIEKIVDKWHEERYDTDWDFLQGSLMKIRKIVKK